MTEALENIRQILSGYIEISEEEWAQYAPMFRIKTYKKNEVVLHTDSICRHTFFVEKGILRVYSIESNGEEKTIHFSLANTFAADYESLVKQTPSSYTIKAMEDTTAVLMSYDMIREGYKILQHGEKLGRLIAEEYFFLFNDKIKSLYTKTPLERYRELNTKFPSLQQRIPQHYIASYLNISSVHLSRLKNGK